MQRELKVTEGRVMVSYPWNYHFLRRMHNNRRQAQVVQKWIWEDLQRKGGLEAFSHEVDK